MHLVVERVKPSIRTPLRRQVERVLKTADLVLRVASRCRHSRTHPSVHASSQQGSFPRPSCVVSAVIGTTTPSATLLASAHFPGLTGYRTRRSCRRRTREGFSSSAAHLVHVPLSLPRRVLRGCISKYFTSSVAFVVTLATRLPLFPSLSEGVVTRRQDSPYATDRAVAPPTGACDVPLRRRAFPLDAGHLLPGTLVFTRTGVPPAGEQQLRIGVQAACLTSFHLPGAPMLLDTQWVRHRCQLAPCSTAAMAPLRP
jgi:hypothetical protein